MYLPTLLEPDSSDAQPSPYQRVLKGYRMSMLGLYTRGGRHLDAALQELRLESGHAPFRARALLLKGMAARGECDWSTADTFLEQATEAFKALQQPPLCALALFLQAEARCAVGSVEEARLLGENYAENATGRLAGTGDLANSNVQLARGFLMEAQQLANLGKCGAPADLWAELTVAEAKLDLGKTLEAETELTKVVDALEANQGFDEAYVRALTLLARARMELCWLPSEPEASALPKAMAAVRRAMAFAVNFPRYVAALTMFQAQLKELKGQDGSERLESALAMYEMCGARLDQGRAIARHVMFAYGRVQKPTQKLVARGRDLLSRSNADQRLKGLVEADSGGGGPSLGASMMGASLMGKSMVGLAFAEDDLELNAVFEVNRAISSVLDLSELLQKVLNEVVKVLKANRGALLRLMPDGSITCVAGYKVVPERVTEKDDEISFSVVNEVKKTQQIVLTDNAQLDARFKGKASILASDIRSIMCAPLKTQKALLGFLYLDSSLKSRVFKDQHKELLSIFATQAAVAVENALMFSELEQLNANLERKVEERTAELAKANDALVQSMEDLRNTELKLLEAQKSALEAEMDVARSIQERIVPGRELLTHAGLKVVGYLQPATHVGGDFWTHIPLPEGKTLLLVGDVTGHGVGSGMLTTVAKAACDTLLRRFGTIELDTLLSTMSDVIYDSASGKLTMTAFACIWDSVEKKVHFANAGHNPPYVLEYGGGIPKLGVLMARGLRLGDGIGNTFQGNSRALLPGDRLILYTDGLVECTNAAGEMYGDRRLRRLLVAQAKLPLDEYLATVTGEPMQFFGAHPRADDVTVVVAEVAG